MKHKVIETIILNLETEIGDKDNTKQFIWDSEDYDMIKNYFESRSVKEVLNITIDGEEKSLEEADKIILDWEYKYLTKQK